VLQIERGGKDCTTDLPGADEIFLKRRCLINQKRLAPANDFYIQAKTKIRKIIWLPLKSLFWNAVCLGNSD
jgi:hypothetical protein